MAITKEQITTLNRDFHEQIEAYRKEGKSYNEIGRITGYSPQRIQQICKKLEAERR